MEKIGTSGTTHGGTSARQVSHKSTMSMASVGSGLSSHRRERREARDGSRGYTAATIAERSRTLYATIVHDKPSRCRHVPRSRDDAAVDRWAGRSTFALPAGIDAGG